MAKSIRFLLIISVPIALLFFSNCRKDVYSTAPLSFSNNDTLTFDTVFTMLGSTTQSFRVFNNSKNPVKISNIQLMHLSGNQFRINVDGIPGDKFANVIIPGRDSIYVFVEVTVNPNDQTSPFVIIDNVNFTIGNRTQTVYLQAFGQNAHYHYGEEIKQSTTWTNDLPHVIISKDTVPGVQVDCGVILTIQSGCKVFFANNAGIFVEGTLNAIASDWQDSIIFRGVRLESYYQDLPGQWFGIVFLRNSPPCAPSAGNFARCVINESSYGIYAGAGVNSNISSYLGTTYCPVVNIQQTIISNCLYDAVYGFNATITSLNSLFYTSGDDLVKLGLGGTYTFTNCTMYNTGSVSVNHQQPVLFLSNLVDSNGVIYRQPLKAAFTNCLVYGSLTNEISFNNADNLDLTYFNNSFTYSALQTPSDTLGIYSTFNTNNLFNQDPRLKNPSMGDYTPSDSAGYFSPLIDYCPTGPSVDLYDHPRPVSKTSNMNKYDIGAIEAQ